MKKYILFKFVSFSLFLITVNFYQILSTDLNSQVWTRMQFLYRSLENKKTAPLVKNWCHQQWHSARKNLKKILSQKKPINFLNEPCISGTMVRREYGLQQIYEETYLKFCISEKTKQILKNVSDTPFGSLPLINNYSINTLGHIYYLARLLESSSLKNLPLHTFIEIGGGYGNLTRLIKQAIPEATIIIIDLPEMCALQWYFLNVTLPESEITLHVNEKSQIIDHAINVVPLSLLNSLSLKTDVFISTFALSECSESFQKYIIEKKFFDASLCYITGQINGWGSSFNFVTHTNLINSVREMFSEIIHQPFHIISSELKSYEIIAIK